MAYKIFYTTILLFIFYSLLLTFSSVQYKNAPQNMWQENMIKMQNFIYTQYTSQNIILGSSLSMGIKPLNDNFYNLAAGGGNPFAGLEILKRTNNKCNKIYIEINYLLTKSASDDKYLGSLFMPILYDLRSYLPPLREKHQPFSLVGFYFQTKVLKNIFSTEGRNGIDNTKNKRIAIFKKEYADSVSIRKKVDENIAKLNYYYLYFKKKGVDIIFYEMPIDCKLEYEPLPIYCRNKILAFCNSHPTKFIPFDDCAQYNTVDGNHLDELSANLYSSFFYNSISQLK